MSKTYHLFISQAMSGLSESDIMAKRDIAIKMMKEHLEKENPDTTIILVVIDNYNKEGPHKDRPVWCLGTSIALMHDADICCFIGDSSMTARGCIVEKTVCDAYGIPYVHFTDSDIEDHLSKNDYPGKWRINVDQFANLYEHNRLTRPWYCKFVNMYTVDTKNVPKDEITSTGLIRVNPYNLPGCITDYAYIAATLINSGLLDNLHSFNVLNLDMCDYDEALKLYVDDLMRRKEHFPVLTSCDIGSEEYKILKSCGFIDVTGTWLGEQFHQNFLYDHKDDPNRVMICTKDDELLRYIYELSFMRKDHTYIEGMNLPLTVVGAHKINIEAALENMGDGSSEGTVV